MSARSIQKYKNLSRFVKELALMCLYLSVIDRKLQLVPKKSNVMSLKVWISNGFAFLSDDLVNTCQHSLSKYPNVSKFMKPITLVNGVISIEKR